MSCILRKTGSTIRFTARIALSEYHVIRPPFQGLFLLAKSITPALACVHSPSPNLSHLLKADVYSPSPFMERGWPIGRGRGHTG